ncbi:hypothetical protein ABZ359_32670 [Streptomyces sp. NPDC005968]|uniref:hypothetical protein n=1 Tax=Streptomyces sp. NPDC005968 TaxID=3154574 RepID=UPI0033CBA946
MQRHPDPVVGDLDRDAGVLAFLEVVVLTHLILYPPTTALDPKELNLATTAELSRRFARIYTTLGTQDPLYRRFCLYRERDFREAPG